MMNTNELENMYKDYYYDYLDDESDCTFVEWLDNCNTDNDADLNQLIEYAKQFEEE